MTESSSYQSIRYTADPRRSAVWAAIAAYLGKWINRDAVTLELAAGYCDLSNGLIAASKTAIDIDPRLPEYAAPDVVSIVGDATDLSDIDDASLDAVLASNFLEHLDHAAIDTLLHQVQRVLKSGGRLVLIQPNFRLAPRRYFDDYTHRTIFTDVSLADLLTARGLVVERVEARFLPLTMKSRLSFGYRLVPFYLRLPRRPFAGQMLVVARRP